MNTTTESPSDREPGSDDDIETLEGLGLRPLDGIALCPECDKETFEIAKLRCVTCPRQEKVVAAFTSLARIATPPLLASMTTDLVARIRARRWITPAARARALGSSGPPIPTGIATLDRATRGGFRAGGLVVVGGAPGAGKTTLVVQLAREWAAAGYRVAFLAADEAADGLLIRVGQTFGLARGALEAGEPDARAMLAVRLEAIPGLTMVDAEEERASVEDVAQWMIPPAILIVDSLQTVRAAGTDDATDPRARVGAAVAALKAAGRAGLMVVATCELARGAYRSRNTADQIDDLAAFKESGAIEYGAHLALVLRSVKDEAGTFDVTVPKNRWGTRPTFRLVMNFERATLTETAAPTAGAGWIPEMNSEARFAADMEAFRQILRDNPGIAGNERLCAMVKGKGVGTTRVRAAMGALYKSGEIVNRGTARRPKLYLEASGSPESPESPQSPGESGEGAVGPESPESPDPLRGEGDGESPGEGAAAASPIENIPAEIARAPGSAGPLSRASRHLAPEAPKGLRP